MRGTRHDGLRGRALPACLLVMLLWLGHAYAGDEPEQPRLKPLPQKLDVMVCLDTSATMEGLRDGLGDGLWRLADDFYSERPNMDFYLGLLRYGAEGPARTDTPPAGERPDTRDVVGVPEVLENLTLNFDAISEQLERLTIGGGREYVAHALDVALREADWKSGSTRMIILAGNESPDQDPARDVLALCRRARGLGITVHALYCGGAEDLHASAWRAMAEAGGGRFGVFDLEVPQRPAHIPTPYDRTLAGLSGRLTATYLYGVGQTATHDRMRRADRQAAKRSLALSADRAVARALQPADASKDLVSRHATGQPVAPETLPPALRKLAPKARASALAARAKQRRELRTRIRALAAQRTRWRRTQPRPAPTHPGARRLESVLRELVLGASPIPR